MNNIIDRSRSSLKDINLVKDNEKYFLEIVVEHRFKNSISEEIFTVEFPIDVSRCKFLR